MKCDLEIWQDPIGEKEPLMLAKYERVDVQCLRFAPGGTARNSNDDMSAIARRDGIEVARMETFDDYPIEMREDRIIISGIIKPSADRPMLDGEPDTPYGEWVLIITCA